MTLGEILGGILSFFSGAGIGFHIGRKTSIKQTSRDHASQIAAEKIGTVNSGNTYNCDISLAKEDDRQANLREEGKKDRKERKWRPVTPGEKKYMQVISNHAPFPALYAYKSNNYIDEDDGLEKYDLIVRTQNGGRIEYYDSINKERISSMTTPGEVYWDIMRITAKEKNVLSNATEVYPTPNEIDNQTVRESVKRELSDLLAAVESKSGNPIPLTPPHTTC